jgi:hypothetical protein
MIKTPKNPGISAQLRRVRLAFLIVPALAGTLSAHPAAAQDAHYWNNQYGSRAKLLGGLVVGSFADFSATYYNPAALAATDIDGYAVEVGTQAVELVDINITRPTHPDVDLSSTRLRGVPSMIALSLPALGDHRVAISVLTRYDFSLEFDANDITTREELESGAAMDASAREILARSRLAESWAGPSWGYPVSRRVAVGATAYFALRSQTLRTSLTEGVVRPDETASSLKFAEEARYWDVRVLSKLGIAYDGGPITLGLTFTTPSVNLFGSGRSYRETTENPTPPVSAGDPVPSLEASRQDGLPARYRSPLSVATGARYQVGQTGLYFSGEWFDSVGEYVVIDATDFVGQTSGDTISIDRTQRNASVFNWGLGVDHSFSEHFQLYGAFTTDRSNIEEPFDQANLAAATWDIFHLSVGIGFRIESAAITLGIAQGLGSQEDRMILGLPGETANYRYSSTRLLLGFVLGT